MRVSRLSGLSHVCSLLLFLCASMTAQTVTDEAARMLPDRVGDFRAQGAISRPATSSVLGSVEPKDFFVVSESERTYLAPSGDAYQVTLIKTSSDSAAYSLLTHATPSQAAKLDVVGTDGRVTPGLDTFCKGSTFVRIKGPGDNEERARTLTELGRLLAGTLEGEADSIPVLVQHLPDWEKVRDSADYAVSLPVLQALVGSRPVLDAVSFDGGAEAVTAIYGGTRIVIIEFTTPQYATDNDLRITQRIEQLRASGQPVPSAYSRVGNYSVFVFDAPDEESAKQLLGGVRYEKDVRWLGDNPRALERAQREYSLTTANVIVTTLKITGLAIILCLGVGSIFGGAIFMYRRAQGATQEVFSDAGGMVRLNIDEITSPADPSRLLGRGDN